MSTFGNNPWMAACLGVQINNPVTGLAVGRSDVVHPGTGLWYSWDSVAEEITLTADAGFTRASTAADVTVTAAAGTITLLDYDLEAITERGVAIVDGQSIVVDIRIEEWRNADAEVAGFCDMQVHLSYHDGVVDPSLLLNAPGTDQVTSSAWEAGLTVTAVITGDTTLRVTAVSTTTTVRCAVSLAHRAPRTRSVV